MPAVLARQILPNSLYQNSSLMPYSAGGTLDALFMGMVVMQAITYSRFLWTDSRFVVIIVSLGVLGTTGASIIVILWQQSIFVWGYGNILTTTVAKWYMFLASFNIAITFLVQMIYIDRSRKLYQHWWPVAVITPFALAAFACQVAFVHLTYGAKYLNFDVMFNDPVSNGLSNAYLSLTLVTDFLITVVVVYGLYRVQTGWVHTDRKLKQLIITCFEAQIPALCIAAVALACWPNKDPKIMSFFMCTSKVYVLGMLITLNLRGSPEASSADMEVTFASSTGQRAKQVSSPPCFYMLVELTNELQIASISSEGVSSYAQAEEGTLRRKSLMEADKVREDGEGSPVTSLGHPTEQLSYSSDPIGPPAYRVYVGV